LARDRQGLAPVPAADHDARPLSRLLAVSKKVRPGTTHYRVRGNRRTRCRSPNSAGRNRSRWARSRLPKRKTSAHNRGKTNNGRFGERMTMAKFSRRGALRAGLATVAALTLTAGAEAADPIKVGVTITQSPPGSVVQGTQVKDGLEVAAKIINDAGGVDGRKIELVIEDTQGLPEKARAAVEKLATRDKVAAITGEHQSSAALAGIEVAHRYKIPYVNTNAWSDVVREK